MPLRPILRLLLAGLLALLAPAAWPTVRTGVINHAPTAHADGPGDWPMFRRVLAHSGRLDAGDTMYRANVAQ